MESVKLTQYPKEDEKYLYFYFSKNDSEDYIDLQQRVGDCAIITPVPNLYPYDTTINVQYKISKDSDESELPCGKRFKYTSQDGYDVKWEEGYEDLMEEENNNEGDVEDNE
jgi:hypothetical protein